jgi:hypothetical protein
MKTLPFIESKAVWTTPPAKLNTHCSPAMGGIFASLRPAAGNALTGSAQPGLSFF